MFKPHICFALILLLASCAHKKEQDPELVSQQEHMQENMKQRLSIFFCTGDVYFRACFDTNPDECVEVVQDNFDDCLPKVMPHPFRGRAAHKYSQKLGQCLGHRYDVVMRDKGKFVGKNNPSCKKSMEEVKEEKIKEEVQEVKEES